MRPAPFAANEDIRSANQDLVKQRNELQTKVQKSANDLLQRLKSKADAKDPSGLQDLREVPSAGTRVQGAATKVGATVCAQ